MHNTERSYGPKQPRFSTVIRHLRETRQLSRQELANRAHTSVGYIAKLETVVDISPSLPVLLSIAEALKTCPDQKRYLGELLRAQQARAVNRSRQEYETMFPDSLRHAVRTIESFPVAYLDTRWNVIEANRTFNERFPGLDETNNVLRWYFLNPNSSRVLSEWNSEATYLVQRYRAACARYFVDDDNEELLRKLSISTEFINLGTSCSVAYNRTQAHMTIKCTSNGKQRTLLPILHNYELHGNRFLYFNGVEQSTALA